AYSPGGRFSSRYSPCASVTSAAAPPIRAGLAASTVTPTRTAPVSSLTKPRRPPVAVCADAVAGTSVIARTASSLQAGTIGTSPSCDVLTRSARMEARRMSACQSTAPQVARSARRDDGGQDHHGGHRPPRHAALAEEDEPAVEAGSERRRLASKERQHVSHEQCALRIERRVGHAVVERLILLTAADLILEEAGRDPDRLDERARRR